MIPRHLGATMSAFPPQRMEAVTFQSQGPPATFTSYAVARAVKRELTKDEMTAAGALAAKRVYVWELWADILALTTPSAAPAPKISDRIIDSSGGLWGIKDVKTGLLGQLYTCTSQAGVP